MTSEVRDSGEIGALDGSRVRRGIERDDRRERFVVRADIRAAEEFGVDIHSGAYERIATALESDDERAADLDEMSEGTDRLVDELWYELYGLTDEEIEIGEVGD